MVIYKKKLKKLKINSVQIWQLNNRQIVQKKAKSSILNNCCSSEQYKAERRVRQGYHLSPYMFRLDAEILIISIWNNYEIQGIAYTFPMTNVRSLSRGPDSLVM